MKLSNKLRSGRKDKVEADVSYLEQTSKLSQNLRNKEVPNFKMRSASDVGVSNLQVGGSYGGMSHGMLTILGNAALGALGGAVGGLGGGMATPLQGYGMPMGPGMPGMMGPGMPHPAMMGRMAPRMVPPGGYMGQGPMRHR